MANTAGRLCASCGCSKVELNIPLGPPCVFDFYGMLVVRLNWPRGCLPTSLAFFLLCLWIESFFVWVVISMDSHREMRQEPLQDHVYDTIKNWKWLSYLSPSEGPQGAIIGFTLLCIFSQKTYDISSGISDSLFRMGLLRLLRISVFMCTNMPSPHSGCYLDRFQQEERARGWWHMAVMMKPHGGCNDLLFSGHIAFSGSFVMGFMRVPGYYRCKALIFLMFFIDALLRIQHRMHYSVDIWLSCIITASCNRRAPPN